MCSVQLQIDSHLSHRLEAVTLLQQELTPGRPLDAQGTLREAVKIGLDVMLGEALARQRPRRRPASRVPGG